MLLLVLRVSYLEIHFLGKKGIFYKKIFFSGILKYIYGLYRRCCFWNILSLFNVLSFFWIKTLVDENIVIIRLILPFITMFLCKLFCLLLVKLLKFTTRSICTKKENLSDKISTTEELKLVEMIWGQFKIFGENFPDLGRSFMSNNPQ